jgi:hypothetical protein
MLPLTFDGEPDVIIPSRIPIPTTKEERKEIIKEEIQEQQIICSLNPELAPSICKPKLKFKKKE